MKTYKVDSISKYLALLESNHISDYIYRGQNEPYFSIQASGFRPYWGGWDSDMIYDMPYLHTAFYNRVIGQLSADEKKYFLAFCQHHGIPTNLVDVSYSPLVALFFACDGKSERKFTLSEFIGNKSIDDFEKDTSYQSIFIHNVINQAKKRNHSSYAQIYMLNKKRLINITDLIVELSGKNLFEELLTDETLTMKLFSLIKEHFTSIDSDTLNVWLKNIVAEFVRIKESHNTSLVSDELYSSAKSMLSAGLSDITYNDIMQFCEKACRSERYQKVCPELFTMQNINCDTIASLYTILLIEILDTLKNASGKANIDLDIYFTYQPPQLFKRIASQQSFFIYQPYLYTNDGVYDYCELNMHSINPDTLKFEDWMLREEKGTLLDEYYLCGETLTRDECKKQVSERSKVSRFVKPRKNKSDVYAVILDSDQFFYDRFYKTIDTCCFECGKSISGKACYFPKTHPMHYDFQYEDYPDYFYYCSDDCKYKSTQKMRSTEGEWQSREGYEDNGGIFGYIYHIYNRIEDKHYIGQTKYMPFFRWQEHVKSGLKGNLCDLVFKAICEVRVKSQEYLNDIEAWWIQHYINEYGKEKVMNLTSPQVTVAHLIERFEDMKKEATHD